MSTEVKFSNGKVYRKFTPEWSNSGYINMNKIPDLVQSLIDQRNSMLAYIESLHNKIDFIIEKNNLCDQNGCLTANCTSDHK